MNVNVHAAISAFIRTVLLFLLSANTVYSQFSIGAAPASMGYTGTALKNSSWAVFNNPAWISTEKKTVSFFVHRFAGLHELTDISASFSAPLPFGAAAAGIHRFGYDLYSEYRISTAYKKQLDSVHAGIVIAYHHVTIGGGYGSAGAAGISAGIGIELTQNIHLGIRSGYLNRPKLGNSDEPVTSAASAGFRYIISERAYLTGDIVKEPNFPLSGRAGFELQLSDAFCLRSGLSDQPSIYSFGVGYNTGAFAVNLGVQQNALLGLSAAMDFTLTF
jgi:hypothetical protein